MTPIHRKRVQNAFAHSLGRAFDLHSGKHVNFEVVQEFAQEVRNHYVQGRTSARLYWHKASDHKGTCSQEQEYTFLWLEANMPLVLRYWGLECNDYSITRYTDEFIIGFHKVKIPTCTSGRISV
ncbi:hypothetical protein VPHD37_0053 [Vibrio phage D37]